MKELIENFLKLPCTDNIIDTFAKFYTVIFAYLPFHIKDDMSLNFIFETLLY